jgi:hypothetical protein
MSLKQTFLLVILALTIGLGCATRSSTGTASPQTPAKKFTTADLAKLRWIEGTWRGTGDIDKPFFERYRFEGDSILAIDGFEDEKLTKVTDTTRYELKDGEFGGGNEGFRWIASVIDDKSITFIPVAKARNSFRFERESKDSWKAVLNWPAITDKPARERVYKMERWPKQ